MKSALRAALVAAGVSLAACHSKRDVETREAPAGRLAPVPPPAGLLAEGAIGTPNATWQRLQRGAGGGAGLLPTTLGGLICAAVGLDPRLGAEVNGDSPAYVAVAGDPASPSWVFAARLVEERRARPLYEGQGAVFALTDAGDGLGTLSAIGRPVAQGAPGVVTGVAPGGWVLVASSPAALVMLAPYATRTLPAKPATTESLSVDVPQSALAGALASTVAQTWDDAQRAMIESDRALREAHGGRAPDYGDPRAIVRALDGWVQRRVGALRDLRGAHVAIDVGESDLRAVVTAAPASPGGAASAIAAALHSGDIAPLARMPRETLAGILVRDDPAARASDAADVEAARATTLGRRLSADDAKRVHAAIDDWSRARGDWATLALTFTPTDRGAVADVGAVDPARAARGVREAVELFAHVPAIHEPLGEWLHARSVTFSTAVVPSGGRASVATFLSDQSPPVLLAWTPGAPESSDGAAPADVKLALGAAPLPLLAPALPGTTLGDDPELHAALGAVGPVAGALVLQPSRSPGCNATGGVLLAWGTRPAATAPGGETANAAPAALWATIVASDSSLRCAVKYFF